MPCHQSAYRSFCSTKTAILAIHNDIVRTIDSGKISVLILLYLSAVFDTMDHSVLLLSSPRLSLCPWQSTWLVWIISMQLNPDIPGQGSAVQSLFGRLQHSSRISDQAPWPQYANDSQMIFQVLLQGSQNCIEAIQVWCNSRRQRPTKSGSDPGRIRRKLPNSISWICWSIKFLSLYLSIYIGLDIIKPVNVVRDLGVNSK